METNVTLQNQAFSWVTMRAKPCRVYCTKSESGQVQVGQGFVQPDLVKESLLMAEGWAG